MTFMSLLTQLRHSSPQSHASVHESLFEKQEHSTIAGSLTVTAK